jgi:predicted acyltransferase
VNPEPAPIPSPSPGRVLSLDALRGFDLFWILGADAVVQALAKMIPVAPLKFLAGQVDHVEWAGLHFYDLIFPLFVFIAGTSMVFSLPRQLAERGRAATVMRILRRSVLLALLGLMYNGGFTHPWPDVRLLGVLQRIGFAYGVAALLFCFTSARTRLGVGVALLVGYWAVLTFVPIRDCTISREAMAAHFHTDHPDPAQVRALFEQTSARVSGRFEPGLNVANHFDFEHLPGRMYDTYWDPEGILSMLPAIVTCLLGVMAGEWLRDARLDSVGKLVRLLVAGVVCLALGLAWSMQFPIVKKIWTSSFVLAAGGCSFLLLAAFFLIIDVRQWRAWCRPFVWIGRNPITLYLATPIVGMSELDQRLAGGSVALLADQVVMPGAGELLTSVVLLGIFVLLAWFLDRRRIYLRI